MTSRSRSPSAGCSYRTAISTLLPSSSDSACRPTGWCELVVARTPAKKRSSASLKRRPKLGNRESGIGQLQQRDRERERERESARGIGDVIPCLGRRITRWPALYV